MQRYNQGFGCFGPMEKCDSGKWYRAEEVDQTIARLLSELDDRNTSWRAIRAQNSRLFLRLVFAVLAALAGGGVISLALLKYAFTGVIL